MKARIGGLTALAAISLLCMTGVASAKAVKVVAPIQGGNVFCATNEPGDPVLGTVGFKRSGNLVSLKAKLTHEAPGSTYNISLWYWNSAAATCEMEGSSFVVTTNSKGKGKGSLSNIAVPASATGEFSARVENAATGAFDETAPVLLP